MPSQEPIDFDKDLVPVDDPIANRASYYRKLKTAFSSIPAASNDLHELRIEDVEFDDPDTAKFSRPALKKARLEGSTPSFPVRGRYALYNKATGELLSKTGRKTLANVPWIDQDGTLIREGVVMAPLNQARLLPSVYHRITADGLPEAMFNARPRTGKSFRIHLDPESGSFFLNESNRKLPLYPILREMGVGDDEIESAWGPGVFKENKDAKVSTRYNEWLTAVNATGAKIRSRATGELPEKLLEDRTANLRSYFGKIELDPSATATTLGKPYANATPDTFLAATGKLLNIHRGVEQTDDRDSLEFQSIHDMGDVLAENIVKDNGGILRETLWKLGGKWAGDTSRIPSGLLNSHIDNYLGASGLAQAVDQVSPYETMNHVQRLVRMGEGGISSMESVPKEARNVIPSYLGFVDPIRSPECYGAETLVMSQTGWVGVADVTAYTKLACQVDGKVAYSKPDKLHAYDFDGELFCGENGSSKYAVTPDHRMWVRVLDEWKFVKASEAHGSHIIVNASIDGVAPSTIPPKQQWREPFVGKVYCVTVPGGLIYVRHKDSVQGFWCGNSLKVGVDSFIARGVAKGPDGQFYKQFIDARSGKKRWVGMREAAKLNIFIPTPDSDPSDEFVPAMVAGKQIYYIPRKEVDLELASGDDMLSAGGDSVPLRGQIKGMRYLMGAKYLGHALPLEKREAPLVQNFAHNGEPFAQYAGRLGGAIHSDLDGVVSSVDDDTVTVESADGTVRTHELFNNYPLARKTRMESYAKVTPGQKVKKGQLLATSNFTDDGGHLAMGRNLRVMYAPYWGRNFEDGVVISQSAADSLTAHMMHTFDHSPSGGAVADKMKYLQLFPGKYDDRQVGKLDENGIIRPGQLLEYGDPIILAHTREEPALSSMGAPRNVDSSATWHFKSPGVVTDVVANKDGGWTVAVKSNDKFRLGDKLALPFGNKGVCSKVIANELMPRTADGEPIDVIFNPLGVPSRTNTAQITAALFGKVAAKRGKPYVFGSFSPEAHIEVALAEAKKHNVPVLEDVIDPIHNIRLPGMFVGNSYTYRLQQGAEGGSHSRGTAGYTYDETPSRGGETGAKHIGTTEVSALLASGAQDVMKDMKMVRGQANPDFWRDVRAGRTPQMPGEPFVREKFRNMLRGAGISYSISEDGAHKLFAMTNDDLHALTGDRKVETAATFDAKTLRPLPGGLFDPGATGSETTGDRFAYMDVPEPILNPMMESTVRTLLGVTKKELSSIQRGDIEYNGKRGGPALQEILRNFDVDGVEKSAKLQLQSGSAQKRDAAMKRLIAARAVRRNDVKLDQFMMDRIPVVPPKYRPIIEHGDRVMVNDLNYLYKKFVDARDDFRESAGLGEEAQKEAREKLYKSFKAITGIEDTEDEKLQERRVGGVLDLILGKNSPKMGFSMRKLLGADVDMTGLGVAIPDPDLKLDELGVPKERLWDMYKNYVIRELRLNGMPAQSAVQHFKDQSPGAEAALMKVVAARPMLLNRAPTLHRYSISALKAVPVEGDAVRVNPFIVKPFNLDFDGDKVSYQVPATDAAVRSANKHLSPVRNLIGVRNMQPNYVPQQEYLMGLKALSDAPDPTKKPIRFATAADVEKAYRNGEIGPNDPVLVG